MKTQSKMTEKEAEQAIVNKLQQVFNDGYKEAIMDLLEYLETKANELEGSNHEIQ